MAKRNLDKEISAFDKWFIENYSRLKESISLKSLLDEDAFHEAYLAVITNSKLSENMIDFRKVFLTTYRTISRRSLNESYTVCHPNELFFTLLPDTDVEDEPKKDLSRLVATIRGFIKNTFTPLQKDIWQMRLQGYSIKDTADSFGISNGQVMTEINIVRSRTCEQFACVI